MSRIDCSLLGVEKFLLLKALHGLKEESGKQSDSIFRKRHFPQVPVIFPQRPVSHMRLIIIRGGAGFLE